MSDTAQLGYVAFARQDARGAPAAALGAHAVQARSIGIEPNFDLLTPDPEIGGSRDVDTSTPALGGYKAAGNVEVYLRPREFPLLMLGAGLTPAAPAAEAGAGAWMHRFTPGAATYLTVETGYGDGRATRRFSDCLVNTLSMSVDANDYVQATASLLAVGEQWQAAPSVPVYETDPLLTYLGSAITFDGLGTYRFQSMSWELNNNLSDDEYVIGSRTLDDVTPRQREITMSGTIKLGDNNPAVTDLYRAFAYGSKTATGPGVSDVYHASATITFGSPRLIGTSAVNRYRYIVTLPDLVISAFPTGQSGADVLTVDLEARALRPAGGASIVQVDVWNGLSTAYDAY